MNFVCILLLIGLSAAARCDKFVTGLVWIHEIAGEETSTTYQGCKKGCFNNGTTNDDGSQKCEKCSIIEEEKLCVQNALTCQWKSGKCVSQSCPQMAKETNTRHALYKECVEGSPKEQAFNNDYWNDYKNNHNNLITFPGEDPTFLNFLNKDSCDKLDNTNCKMLPETAKNKCYFDVQEGWYNDYGVVGKNRSVACLTEQYELLSYYTFPPGGANTRLANLGGNQTLFKLYYGFSTPAEVCNDDISRRLKQCDSSYFTGFYFSDLMISVSGIDNCKSSFGADYRTSKNLDHIETKEARTKCHLVYGCMYSKDNERCSVWSVWAFVLVLVLCILVVVVILVVVCFLVLSKLIGKKSKTSPVESESESANRPPAGGNEDATTEKSIAPTGSESAAAGAGAVVGGGEASPSSSSSSSSPAGGHYVLIKLGKQEKQTKKNANLAWGETVVFTDVGGEDDDAEIVLHEDNGSMVGTGSLRITSYVGKKEIVSVPVLDGGAEKGTLELEVDVIVKEDQQPPSIIATFVVQKGFKK